MYLYWAQYLHILQDSKCYLTIRQHRYSPNSQVTDIPLTERQRLKDDHLSTSLWFFSLPLGYRTQWQRTAILRGHPSHYLSACTWVWTHAPWVPRQVCYPLGHSGRYSVYIVWGTKNMKMSIFNLRLPHYFFMVFTATKTRRSSVEIPFQVCIEHSCRILDFRNIYK